MKFNFGLIYKRMLDFLRSSKILLLYFWGIKVEEKIHDYFWDVVTINLKNLIDKQHLEKFNCYLDMGCGHIAILGIYFKKNTRLAV